MAGDCCSSVTRIYVLIMKINCRASLLGGFTPYTAMQSTGRQRDNHVSRLGREDELPLETLAAKAHRTSD
jgi:hypothetical protein